VQLLSAHQPWVRARHSDLLVAGSLGERCWVCALTAAPSGEVHLRAVRDPASSAWDPAASPGAAGDRDPLRVLPLSRVAAPAVLVTAA